MSLLGPTWPPIDQDDIKPLCDAIREYGYRADFYHVITAWRYASMHEHGLTWVDPRGMRSEEILRGLLMFLTPTETT